MLVFGFFALEAKKEVYFLCLNFNEGDSFTSVMNQLNTVSLSEYSIDDTPQQKRITLNSPLSAYLVSCTIIFDHQDKVILISYD